jgi:IS30 family transposase
VRPGGYWASTAHQQAKCEAQSSHRRPLKLCPKRNPELLLRIYHYLGKRWSPQQISRYLMHTEPPENHVSAETIYSYIYMLPRGELKKELIRYLRHKKPNRKSRKKQANQPTRGKIPDMISIHERPPEVAHRTIPGDWEGDLIIGKDHQSAIATIVERSTRYVLLVKLPAYDAETVWKAVARRLNVLPQSLRVSLTWDQGKEMAQHKRFAMATNMKVYFCDPASPWQRGTCENTNMLIRDFFPKGTDFNNISWQKLNYVQHCLNERPRQTLNWKTPKQALAQLLHNS